MPCYGITGGKSMNQHMKYAVLIIAFVVIGALIAGCTQQAAQTPSQQNAVKVGVIASLTGPASNVGTSMWQSAQVAAAEINANGGITINGTKVPIQLIVGDDESTQQGGQTAATQLITGDKVDILVGGYSSAVTSSYEQTVAEYKIPYIVTGASSPIITHRTDIDTSTSSTTAHNRHLRAIHHDIYRPGNPARRQPEAECPCHPPAPPRPDLPGYCIRQGCSDSGKCHDHQE